MPKVAPAVIRDQSPPLFLMTPKALPLIPLVRFPGFPWLIAAAWLLPNMRAAELAASDH